jgi:dTDP-4-amino-4,6-dideoxygalactose transaminase
MWSQVVESGDFTLGRAVHEFEKNFAKLIGVKHAIGVANGTDALELSLWMAGVRFGDEVIVPANTFVASLGCIGNLQAKPVLVDIGLDYVMDPELIEAAITPKTKAIIPVHFCGNPVDMDKVMAVANKHGLAVIEDACQAYMAKYKDKYVGGFGLTGAFSLHPLKILNVWGDGGMITTNNDKIADELRLLQNHGLQDRDTITRFPCRNSRLDSIHAVVGNMQIMDTPVNVERRRSNAAYYDGALRGHVHVINRDPDKQSVFHLYFIEVSAELRDKLYNYLLSAGVEAKIHYKTPLYLQPGLAGLGYEKGRFPVSDELCDRIITLPVDEFVTREMQDYVIKAVKEFMAR